MATQLSELSKFWLNTRKKRAEMQSILITGGAGFIGSNFIHHLHAHVQDVNIVNLDALTYAGNLENLRTLETSDRYHFVHGSINDSDLLTDLFQRFAFHVVFHFAAESHVDRSILGPAAFIETNVNGTFQLLETARQQWLGGTQKSGRFIHISTDEVYGSLGDAGYFREDTAYAPNSPYAASKAASDHLVRAYHHTFGLDTVTTNCSNNYGPFQFPEKLIPLMIQNAVNGKELPIYGDGRNIRDWLFVEDHCRALQLAWQAGRSGETYNIGGNNERTNIDIVETICDLIDTHLGRSGEQSTRKQIRFVKDRPGHDRRYAIDATKIRTELGWEAHTDLASGLEKTIDWYLKNSDWVKRIIDGEYQHYYKANYGDK
jgi:dTDP-glucose 4,6-dehydratase